jgi:hypothetical protein
MYNELNFNATNFLDGSILSNLEPIEYQLSQAVKISQAVKNAIG